MPYMFCGAAGVCACLKSFSDYMCVTLKILKINVQNQWSKSNLIINAQNPQNPQKPLKNIKKPRMCSNVLECAQKTSNVLECARVCSKNLQCAQKTSSVLKKH